MSAFLDDITEEEKLSGFEANELGDESFKLESIDAYPGILPELEHLEDSVIPAKGNGLSLAKDDSFYDSDKAEKPFEEIEDVELSNLNLEEDKIDSNNESEELVNQNKDNGSENEINQESAPEQNAIEDLELKELLESELNRSKKRKSENSSNEIEEPSEDNIEELSEQFIPVEEKSDIEEIEITKLDIDKPSTFNLDYEKLEEKQLDTNSEKIETVEEEEKVNKKKPFFTTKRVLALGVILLALILLPLIILYDDIVRKNKLNLSLFENDTTEIQINREDIYQNDSLYEKREPIELSLFIDSNSNNDNLDTLEMIKPKKINSNKKIENEQVKFSRNNNPEQKPKKIIEKNQLDDINKSSYKKLNVLNQPLEPKGLNKEGLFRVQIISTPSYDDAKDWLSKLNDRGIYDGDISKKIIRDQTWYRVRFGNFKTYDEASEALNKAGFNGSWVDRVK